MMHYLIAQAATQPIVNPEVWSGVERVIAQLVTLCAAIGALILTWRNSTKATEAKATAEAAQGTAHQAVSHAQSLDRQMTDLALNTPAPTQRPANPPSPLLLLPLLLLPFLTGCALFNAKAASEDKVAALEKTFASTVTALTQLRHEGKLSDAEWASTKEISEGIDAAFESLHNDLDAGRKVDVNAVLDGIRASLQRLSTYQTEATRREPSHASTPARRSGPARNLGQERIHRRAA